jgi:hypothetical protein
MNEVLSGDKAIQFDINITPKSAALFGMALFFAVVLALIISKKA